MDVHLTREALWYLEGQALDSKAASRGGLLLGHKRGQRFYVEKAFPCRPSFFLSLANFWALDRHFHGKIIGFYSLRSRDKNRSRFLQPFACGKLYLEVRPGPKKMRFRPWIVDFEKRFFFRRATIFAEGGG